MPSRKYRSTRACTERSGDRKNLDALASNRGDLFEETLAAEDLALTPRLPPMQPPISVLLDLPPPVDVVRDVSEVVVALHDLAVVVDPKNHTAWFAGTAEGDLKSRDKPQHATWRINGVALDRAGWKLTAINYARVITDKELFQRADPGVVPPSVRPYDNRPASQAVANWFQGGAIAADRSTSKSALARGTAPLEVAAGAAADKLAKAWDGLGMWLGLIYGRQWGSAACVYADLGLPVKQHGAVKLRLSAVLVQEGERWKWVSLDFAPGDQPRR